MCLAVPAQIITIGEHGRATVDMLGVRRDISLRCTPDANIGDYVLVHAGFGIQVIDPREALETIRLVQELPELLGEDFATADNGACVPSTDAAHAAQDDTPAEAGA